MNDTILVIDTGSSSMRGILFDREGRILFTHQIPYTMVVGKDESAVMDPGIFTDCLEQIARRAAAELQAGGYRLLAVSMDSQRSSVLAVDRQIRPLHPILMWYDKRCAGICSDFPPETLRTIYEQCGMRLTPVSSAPKMLWLKRNLPQIYESAYKLIGIHDYLLHALTGELVTDATCACRTALMDIRSFTWSEQLLSIFEIHREKLCPIVAAGTIVGMVTEAFSARTGLPRVPVITAGGDQQCGLWGQGRLEQDTVSVNSGSASYLAVPVSRPVPDPKMEVNISAFHGTFPWVLEAANMGSGTLYQWFNRNFYHNGEDKKDITQINREVAAQPPGCDGLLCYPDFAGRGCPDTDLHARGCFCGIGLQHTRGSFARAILEGICFDICDCIGHMKALGIPIRRIRSTGGLTNFPVFNQILADISGMQVQVCACPETTAVGAYYVACAALSIAPGAVESGPRTVYHPDPEAGNIYDFLGEKRKNRGKENRSFTFPCISSTI